MHCSCTIARMLALPRSTEIYVYRKDNSSVTVVCYSATTYTKLHDLNITIQMCRVMEV